MRGDGHVPQPEDDLVDEEHADHRGQRCHRVDPPTQPKVRVEAHRVHGQPQDEVVARRRDIVAQRLHARHVEAGEDGRVCCRDA